MLFRSPHTSLPTPSLVLLEGSERNTPSPHPDLPTPSSFFLREASSRATSRASSVHDSITERSPDLLAMSEYNAPDAHLTPLPASREPSIAESTGSLGTHTPLGSVDGNDIDDREMRLLAGIEAISHGVLTPKSSYSNNYIGEQASGPTAQNIRPALPSSEKVQQTTKWVRSGRGGRGSDWVRVME